MECVSIRETESEAELEFIMSLRPDTIVWALTAEEEAQFD